MDSHPEPGIGAELSMNEDAAYNHGLVPWRWHQTHIPAHRIWCHDCGNSRVPQKVAAEAIGFCSGG